MLIDQIDFSHVTDTEKQALIQDLGTQKWIKNLATAYHFVRPPKVEAVNYNPANGTVFSSQIRVEGQPYLQAHDDLLEEPKLGKKESRLAEYRRDFAAVALELVVIKGSKSTSHWVMVEQWRMGGEMPGKKLEIAAGMIDSSNVQLNALRELKEETGIKLDTKNLIPLGPYTVSAPWSNETGSLYYARALATSKTIKAIEGRAAGNEAQNEATIVRLIAEKDLPAAIRQCMKNQVIDTAILRVRPLTQKDFDQKATTMKKRLQSAKGSAIEVYKPSPRVLEKVRSALSL